MGVFDDITDRDIEISERMTAALRAMSSAVVSDPKKAAAGLVGAGIEWLAQEGIDECTIHKMVSWLFANTSDINAAVARRTFHVVLNNEDPTPSKDSHETD